MKKAIGDEIVFGSNNLAANQLADEQSVENVL